MELTKKDKKVARQLIDNGLNKEFENGLNKAAAVLKNWNDKVNDNRDSYHILYKTIKDFDKHIARRYDGRIGSDYFNIVLEQLRDGLIKESDLNNFSEEVRQRLFGINKYLIE